MIGIMLALAISASSLECDPNDAKSCLQIVVKGETVPFTGALLTPRRAAKAGAKAEQCDARVETVQSEMRDRLMLTEKLMVDRLDNAAQSHKLEIDLMMRRMKQLEDSLGPRWYEHPIFVATVTVATTVAVFYGATEVVKATR